MLPVFNRLKKKYNVLWLDRSLMRPDPFHVSLGWLLPQGGRAFPQGKGRKKLRLASMKRGHRTLCLVDYGKSPVKPDADTIRYHPDQVTPTESLKKVLECHDAAFGESSSSLVKAALMGLRVHAADPNHILNQPDWASTLPYADWSEAEISRGEPWALLLPLLSQLQSQSLLQS